MLDDVVDLMTAVERQADRVVSLCHRGESVDNEVAELTSGVTEIVAQFREGVPETLQSRWQQLTARVAAATTAADVRRTLLATELEVHARNDRVRRAYVRPPV